MIRRGRVALALAVLTLAGAGAFHSLRSNSRTQVTSTEDEGGDGLRVRWPVGTELHYRFTWGTASRARIGAHDAGAGLDSGGESTVQGTLVLKVARAQG